MSANPRVVIAGGGVAALETVLALRALCGRQLPIELLASEPDYVHRPLSVAGPFGFGAPTPLPLTEFAEREGTGLIDGRMVRVDPRRRVVSTSDDRVLPYDVLVVAVGARLRPALPGALTFRGPVDVDAMQRLVETVAEGERSTLVFAVSGGVTWALPLYELAIMTAIELRSRAVSGVRIKVTTPEPEPLWIFGAEAGQALRRLLEDRGIELHTNARPVAVAHGELRLTAGAPIAADHVVSLPALEGPAIPGLPHDTTGFIPVDTHGQVAGMRDVYAAGDATAYPLKQGGLATQQADAVAEAVAARIGSLPREPEPFRPVLRGLLLTGGAPLYLRAELGPAADPVDQRAIVASRRLVGEPSTHALWWPPGKVAGRYLAPMLADARPLTPAEAPLLDRTAPRHDTDPGDHEQAVELALLIADQDAKLEDYAQAINALDAAAAMNAGVLPAPYADKRAQWMALHRPPAQARP